MRDDRRELNKQLELMLWIALGLLALHLYVELHTFFVGLGWHHPFADGLIGKMVKGSGLMASPWTLKLIAGGCVVLYCLGSRGVKSLTLTPGKVLTSLLVGAALFAGSTWLLRDNASPFIQRIGVTGTSVLYLVLTAVGLLYLIKGSQGINRLLSFAPEKDIFNDANETFPQQEKKLENDYSVNLPTEYTFKGKTRKGWINIINPFRATMVLGTPGAGKSYSVVNPIIRQHIEKGFTMYVYDYKFPDLSLIAFNAMARHKKNLPKGIRFYVINLDNPAKSHRCNPLAAQYLTDITDAYESAKTIMLNLNKTWINKQGDFFVESPINYVTAIIWFLRQYEGGKYCTFPHVIELIGREYDDVFPILMSRPDLENYMRPFVSAYEGKAMEQLEGQIASARIPLSRLASPTLYWVMNGDDFTLDINNPAEPKILCVGNNPRRQEIYGAALGLYNSRLMRLINQPGKAKSSVVIDELPTIYFRGLDNLIATARSNKVAVTIAMQDFSQLERDYGKQEAEVIKNTVGTVIAGQVTGTSADALQNRLGRNVQRKQSLNIQSEDTTHGIQTELNFMVPAAKIARLSQGWFVGVTADTVEQPSEHKAFHAKILVDDADLKKEQKYEQLPDFSIFANTGTDFETQVQANYLQVKAEIEQLIKAELKRLNSFSKP